MLFQTELYYSLWTCTQQEWDRQISQYITMPQAVQLGKQKTIPWCGIDFSLCSHPQTGLGALLISLPVGIKGIFPLTIATHLHLVLEVKTNWSYIPRRKLRLTVDFTVNPLSVYLTETLNYVKHGLALEGFSSPSQRVPSGSFSSRENGPHLSKPLFSN